MNEKAKRPMREFGWLNKNKIVFLTIRRKRKKRKKKKERQIKRYL